MRLPEQLSAVIEALGRLSRPKLVGGCVRDALLGLESDDYDIEVHGIDFDALHKALAPFGATDVVGRSFGVIKLTLAGKTYDFSLPRRESKSGAGHRGFRVQPEPDLTDFEAALRRDFTVNAIAYDPFSGAWIDPLRGRADLQAKILRHTSPAFADDPLRVLRGFQLSARLDFRLAPETAELCRSIGDAYAQLPVERIWGEWDKWMLKSIRPSRGLEVLAQSGWLRHFPEVDRLRDTPQDPQWHPEGDVFIHTCLCLDALVSLAAWKEADSDKRRMWMLAVLAHDFGKAHTTVRSQKGAVERWISPGHEAAGVPLTERFLGRIGAPQSLTPPVTSLVARHLAHHHAGESGFSDAQLRRLARRLHPATIDDLAVVMTADAMGRPPLSPEDSMMRIAELQRRATELQIRTQAPRPILGGRHLIARGMSPGPGFREILDRAFNEQLEGRFSDDAGASRWLDEYIGKQ